ncbi:MAG: sulfite reductase flavoprotein subunit alpha [Xanthomonadales bacterium]|nr:sulfite reductase flavoprotein subunit alpha [Xanthomonadales bacterium]
MRLLRGIFAGVVSLPGAVVAVPGRAAARRRSLPAGPALGNGLALLVLAALAAWLLPLQGDFALLPVPAARDLSAAGAILVAYAGLLLAFRPRREGGVAARTDGATTLLVAHASQTGFAEELAARTATLVRGSGRSVRVVALGELDAAGLAAAGELLIIASTTGDGDAPDSAMAFVCDVLGRKTDLRPLRYGLLALGDSSYRHYCAFGRQLDAWLRESGAAPLFEPIEVDDGDEEALVRWQLDVARLAATTAPDAWREPEFSNWRLAERRLLNPGSEGGPCFHLALVPQAGGLPAWQAGDIAVIQPRHARAAVEGWLAEVAMDGAATVAVSGGSFTLRELAARSQLPPAEDCRGRLPADIARLLRPLASREYSIASLPQDEAIQLLVRQVRGTDGSLGVGTGWLTEHAEVGAEIILRVRSNANFHGPPDARPLILIGNGSGMAGLRALLKQRVAAGQRRNWMLFGERCADCDFYYAEDIRRWQAEGFVDRLDLAFSRDEPARVYVQDRLRAAAPMLRAWVDAGASIYVCGSLAGMAPGVEEVLVESLGRAGLDRLIAERRYRRDVY